MDSPPDELICKECGQPYTPGNPHVAHVWLPLGKFVVRNPARVARWDGVTLISERKED